MYYTETHKHKDGVEVYIIRIKTTKLLPRLTLPYAILLLKAGISNKQPSVTDNFITLLFCNISDAIPSRQQRKLNWGGMEICFLLHQSGSVWLR